GTGLRAELPGPAHHGPRRRELRRALSAVQGFDGLSPNGAPHYSAWITTGATPARIRPMRSAAARLRSITRPGVNGPRSLMRTTTERPVAGYSTRTRVPKGSVLCAAVSACMSNGSPLAVRRPWWRSPYQDARPRSITGPAPAEGAAAPSPGPPAQPSPGGAGRLAQAARVNTVAASRAMRA